MEKFSRLKKENMKKQAMVDLNALIEFIDPQKLQMIGDQGQQALDKLQQITQQAGTEVIDPQQYSNILKSIIDNIKALQPQADGIKEQLEFLMAAEQ
jgi:hypothetical protein